MIRRQPRRRPPHLHQSDKIRKIHHLLSQQERKSTRNRQATLATAHGNPILISTIQITSSTGTKQFEIDSPPEKSKQDSPSLKSLLQEMGFSKKTPEYKACLQFIQAISPKHRTSTTNNVIDLTSPAEAEDETMENDDIF